MLENLNTLVEVIYNSKKKYGNEVFLKYLENDKFVPITYTKFVGLMEAFAAALYDLGVRKGDKIGIISENLYKWLIADMAIITLGAVDVPRGADSTLLEISYILKHSDAKYCIVQDPAQADKVLSIKKDIPENKCLILFTGDKKDMKEKVPAGIKVFTFDELLERGHKLLDKYKDKLEEIRQSIKEEDLVTIIYTSGTTGNPKGVMLLHKNIMHNVKNLPDVIRIDNRERWLSILPVWHVFERTIEYVVMGTAASMAYSKPTAKYLLPAFEEIKPTVMVSVPRIWEALYQGIINKVKSGPKARQIIFEFFTSIGIFYNKHYKILIGLEPLFRRRPFLVTVHKKIKALLVVFAFWILYQLGKILVFSNIKSKTGGKLRIPISGGGALPGYVDDFFYTVGVKILEGWGLTETAPVVGVRLLERLVPKTVGPAAPGVEIVIGDKTGRPFYNQHRKGTVYVRGDNVMPGYYKDPKSTKAVISDDGWLNTGDLGRMTMTGELQLTGRAKDTIVLLGGENVEPQPIEDKLLESPLIFQVMVVGQDKKVLGALIVPDEAELIHLADKKKIKHQDIKELYANHEIIAEYKKAAKSKINTKNGFRDYERITFITLLDKQFEVGQEMTHSLKVKRNVVSKKYKDVIDKMFG